MKEIFVDELKRLQMEILDAVDAFCSYHGITYSLACGTLLGAIRHKGFIPWDDDVDIQMLRPEYERFLQLWKEQGPAPYVLMNSETGLPIAFSKIVDTRTEVIEWDGTKMGVNIDIFPLDAVKDEADFKRRHRQVMNLYAAVPVKAARFSRKQSLWENIRLAVRKLQYFSLPQGQEIYREMQRIATKEDVSQCAYVFEMVAGRLYRRAFAKEAFCGTTRRAFEDKDYPVMDGYDEYLSACFGDYMKLPPKEKQVSHHRFKAYWK